MKDSLVVRALTLTFAIGAVAVTMIWLSGGETK